jgi:outer membrane phospholipase A
VFRVYALYYNGYVESLIDYDYKNERFGIDIALHDFVGSQ